MGQFHKFWFEFETLNYPTQLNRGCGVTARDKEDAIALITAKVFGNKEVPIITNIIENVELDELNQSHVRPNIGDPEIRGVWFPLGYEASFNSGDTIPN
jgi:hypothetical protein